MCSVERYFIYEEGTVICIMVERQGWRALIFKLTISDSTKMQITVSCLCCQALHFALHFYLCYFVVP